MKAAVQLKKRYGGGTFSRIARARYLGWKDAFDVEFEDGRRIWCMLYYTMQRTQVLLEDWQYEALKAAAERRRRSVSSLVRDLVARYLQPGGSKPRHRLSAIRGLGKDPHARGRDHDRYLYGAAKRHELQLY